MSNTKPVQGFELKFLLRGLISWLISVLILLTIATIIVSKCDISTASIGYISSGLSFLTAFSAGMFALKGNKSGLLVKGMILSSALTIFLLTIGFIIKGDSMNSAGILSVVSFTFSGCLLGCVMSSFFKETKSNHKFSHKSATFKHS